MSNVHLAQFNRALETSAAHWQRRRGLTAQPDDEHQRYNAAAALVKKDILVANPLSADTLAGQLPIFGVQILFRTCYIGALLAKDHGASSGELAEALRADSTVDTLGTIMKSSPVLAGNLESGVGMILTGEPIDPDKKAGWRLTESGLSNTQLDQIRTESIGLPDPRKGIGECPVSRAKMTSAMLASIVTICERDDNLFERSLR